MKKSVALLLSLMIALLSAAFAEEEIPVSETDAPVSENAVHIRLTAALGRDFAQASLPSRIGKISLDSLIEELLYLSDHAAVDMIIGEETACLAFQIDDRAVCTLRGLRQQDSMVFVSELFPHYALQFGLDAYTRVTAGLPVPGQISLTLQAPAEQPSDARQQPDGQMTGRERLREQFAILQPYMDDVRAFVENVQQSARFSEDYTTMDIELTANQLAGLAQSLATRLRDDYTLLSFLQTVMDQTNAFLPETMQMTSEGLVDRLLDASRRLSDKPDRAFAQLTVTNHEDGTGTVKLNSVAGVHMTQETFTDGKKLTLLFCEADTDDTDQLLDSLRRGDNENDAGLVLSVRDADDGDTRTALIDADLYLLGTNLQIRTAQSGSTADPDHPVLRRVTTLSLPRMGGEVFTGVMTVSTAEAPEAPVLKGVKVLQPATMARLDRMGLMRDILDNGLPAVTVSLFQAAPAEASVPEEADTAEAPAEVSAEQPIEAVSGSPVGVWISESGSVTLRADGTCSVVHHGSAFDADYMNRDGFLFINSKSAIMTGSYTDTALTLTLDAETVAYTRQQEN